MVKFLFLISFITFTANAFDDSKFFYAADKLFDDAEKLTLDSVRTVKYKNTKITCYLKEAGSNLIGYEIRTNESLEFSVKKDEILNIEYLDLHHYSDYRLLDYYKELVGETRNSSGSIWKTTLRKNDTHWIFKLTHVGAAKEYRYCFAPIK